MEKNLSLSGANIVALDQLSPSARQALLVFATSKEDGVAPSSGLGHQFDLVVKLVFQPAEDLLAAIKVVGPQLLEVLDRVDNNYAAGISVAAARRIVKIAQLPV